MPKADITRQKVILIRKSHRRELSVVPLLTRHNRRRLYQSYKSYGDYPFIVGPRDNVFSASDYARARCAVLRSHRLTC